MAAKHDLYDETAPRRATNVTINADLLGQAREAGINLSRACERGIAEALAESRAEAWKRQNRKAIEAANAYVAGHGPPLARHRRF